MGVCVQREAYLIDGGKTLSPDGLGQGGGGGHIQLSDTQNL